MAIFSTLTQPQRMDSWGLESFRLKNWYIALIFFLLPFLILIYLELFFDQMITCSQRLVLPLQGRPYYNDDDGDVVNGLLMVQFDMVDMIKKKRAKRRFQRKRSEQPSLGLSPEIFKLHSKALKRPFPEL